MTDDALLAAIRELKVEVRESRKETQGMRERMGRMEEKLDALASIKESTEKAKDTANEALQYAKSAHHRIDEIRVIHEKDVAGVRVSLEEDVKELRESNTWFTRSSIAALLLAASSLIGYVFSLIKK